MSSKGQSRSPPAKQQQQQQQRQPPQKKSTGFLHPSLNILSFFEPAPLSPHPDVDRYLPKVLVGSIVAVTGIMAMIEIAQSYFGAYDDNTEAEIAQEDDHGPTPQFSRKIVVHDKPIPIEQWPRNVSNKLIFQPTRDWQEVPDDCVCPPGLQYELNQTTGKRMARAITK